MKLTDKSRWRYSANLTNLKTIGMVERRGEGLEIAQRIIPDGPYDYLELGCAPGIYTAALIRDKQWTCSGIDYSDDSELFIDTLAAVGKKATLYKLDMFSSRIDKSFDIVASFGLVEHFRGGSLEEVFQLHDHYLKKGGYLVILVPNFTGFQYFWHYLFDRPDLDNHNVDVMQPAAMLWFKKIGYDIVFNDYVGIMRLWGNTGWNKYRLIGKGVAAFAVMLSKIAQLLRLIGIKLQGRSWSPSLLLVARKCDSKVGESE